MSRKLKKKLQQEKLSTINMRIRGLPGFFAFLGGSNPLRGVALP